MVTENTAPNAAADVEMSQYVADRTRVNEDKIKKDDEIISQFGDYNYGWHDSDAAGEAAKRGIDENVVRAISADKGEPQWMLDMRLRGFKAFLEKPMPDWGVDLSGFNADDFKYYVKPIDKQAKSWDELPDDIRNTYDRLGIPEAEKNRLVSGVAAPPTAVWSKSSRARTVRPTRPCAMPCWSTTSPAPIPTRMSTFAKTTFRWPTKPPFPRFPKTSSST